MTSLEITSIKLLFFSMAGVSFAVDAEQVESMAACKPDLDDDVLLAHRLLGFEGLVADYQNPVIIKLKQQQDTDCHRLLIDGLEMISEHNISNISPIPELLAPFLQKRGIWGVLKCENRLSLLVDFCRTGQSSCQ